ASSSAAGGLRLAVIGLVPGLTVEAGNLAALGAGAKVVGAWSFKLDDSAVREIASSRPDMVLLAGGTDGGDRATLLHNARALAAASITVPFVLAGNRFAAEEAAEILLRGGKETRVVPNVMPRYGELTVDGAREAIRGIFMERITAAKGLERIAEVVPAIVPTPMAVLQGALLGAKSRPDEQDGGGLLVVDVGGATTDVHSVGYGTPQGPKLAEQGLPEPFAKRTVEGDLGIRFNARTLLDRAGIENFEKGFRASFSAIGLSREDILRYADAVTRETGFLPKQAWQVALDAELARTAVDIAIERHVGKKERIVAREGESWIYYGKDLTEAKTIIGTGGVFVHNPHAAHILSGKAERERYEVLRPRRARLFVDVSYTLYAAGLLSHSHPEVGRRIFDRYLQPLDPPQP
ncbi:MAG TPA: glutamate mutase L, partial [Candidatus Eisenbacteria bacterium]|nr:glutamate mutase L [Candidatus Eisenbacteria bacterium]